MTATRVVAAGVIAAVLIAAGAGAVTAGGGDDDGADEPITGAARARAEAAALEHTHGGRVTETEAGDEESSYEVEVTRDDGTQIDVQLDADFRVVGDELEPGETD